MKQSVTSLLRRVALAAAGLLTVAMAAATFVEHVRGTAAARAYIYGSPWFAALWAALAAAGTALLLAHRRPHHVVLLHAALALILVGAGLTALTAHEGTMHLRQGTGSDAYLTTDRHTGMPRVRHLPCRVQLEHFVRQFHAGGEAPAGYAARLLITAPDGRQEVQTVRLNAPGRCGSARLFLRSFDADDRGVTLFLRTDPAGTAVSYTGYALLALGLAGMMLSRRGAFRRALRTLGRGGLAATLLATTLWLQPDTAAAAHTLPAAEAEAIGRLLVMSGGRVCPVQTLALDVTRKLYGADRYGGFTAEQVLTGWLFWPEEWEREPMLRIRSAALRRHCHLERYESLSVLRGKEAALLPLVARYQSGERTALPAAAAEVADLMALADDLRRGTLLRVFPVRQEGVTRWVSAAESEVRGPSLRQYAAVAAFQQAHGAESLPPARTVAAERLYNRLSPVVPLARLHLAAGLALLVLLVAQMAGRLRGCGQAADRIGLALAGGSLLVLALHTALRCYVTGRLPLGNAYETLLTVSLSAQAVALAAGLTARHQAAWRVLPALGLLLSGACLTVAGWNAANPQITPLMPVLASPLLSLHVSLVMPAYALLGLTALCAVAALCVRLATPRGGKAAARRAEERLQALARVLLIPALALLGAGIFTGAVWAGEAWGRYWGWDPKETWALITLLVYALPLHAGSAHYLQRPLHWHAYMLGAFLTVLMTYFGVNYWLTGLHSYAG